MKTIKYQGNILSDKHLSLPDDIYEKIKDTKKIKVILLLEERLSDTESEIGSGNERIHSALTEYKSKYPDDEVAPDDFQYVGLLSEIEIENSKFELTDAIESKYHEL